LRRTNTKKSKKKSKKRRPGKTLRTRRHLISGAAGLGKKNAIFE